MAIYSWFSHWKWWFSIAMLVYQRVPQCDAIFDAIFAPNQPEQFEGFKPWVGSPLANTRKKDTNSPHRSNEGWSSWDVGESRFHSLDLQNSPSKGQALQAPPGNWPWPMAKRLSIAASAWGTQGREGWLWYEFFLLQQAQASSFRSFLKL